MERSSCELLFHHFDFHPSVCWEIFFGYFRNEFVLGSKTNVWKSFFIDAVFNEIIVYGFCPIDRQIISSITDIPSISTLQATNMTLNLNLQVGIGFECIQQLFQCFEWFW